MEELYGIIIPPEFDVHHKDYNHDNDDPDNLIVLTHAGHLRWHGLHDPNHYIPTLTEADIQTLVVDDKWLATIAAAVQGELDRVSQTLTGRIRELAERYATPLPQLIDEVATLAARVDGHLKRMGAVWK
jgi:hypothetical protein